MNGREAKSVQGVAEDRGGAGCRAQSRPAFWPLQAQHSFSGSLQSHESPKEETLWLTGKTTCPRRDLLIVLAMWRTLSACCVGILASIPPPSRRAGAPTRHVAREWRHGTPWGVRHVFRARHFRITRREGSHFCHGVLAGPNPGPTQANSGLARPPYKRAIMGIVWPLATPFLRPRNAG